MQLSTRQLTAAYLNHAGSQQLALQDLNLEIRPGEQIALIGPSGAGKSTLLHSLAAALQPSSGQLLLNGQDPWALSNRQRHLLRRQLYLAPQSPPLPARQRVVNTVLAGKLPQWSLWKAFRSLLLPSDAGLAAEALDKFSLQHKLFERVDQLSGGERQRCGLARMLLSDASLLLADEPLSALDPVLARQTLAVLQQEARARNATLICSLHQIDLAGEFFPRILGLRDGRLMFDTAQLSPALLDQLFRGSQPEPVAAPLAADKPAVSLAQPFC